MSKVKRTLLYSVLLSCLAVMPVTAFGAGQYDGYEMEKGEGMSPKKEKMEQKGEKETADRVHFGVYYGRPYYYRPYYYNYPYRPYYYRNYNRPYYNYYW